jgi:hypothetical protein
VQNEECEVQNAGKGLPTMCWRYAMPKPLDPFRQAIREILLTDWDPHNASRFEASHGEYDSYIDPLIDLVRSGKSAAAVIEFLHERERETMCFPSLGTQRLRRVAQRLVRVIRDGPDAPRSA